MAEQNKPAIIVFQIHQEAFTFLGNENVVTETSNFGHIWGHFFDMGGYEPIRPYAIDQKPVNVWYTNALGQNIYFQGLFVQNVDKVPDGYRMVDFPACDFLVVTTEWMAKSEEAVGENGNGQCNRYAQTVSMPQGYRRCDAADTPITVIERENADTPEGSRYEVWVPIRKIAPSC